MKSIDLAGRRFGRWLALKICKQTQSKIKWHVRCDCGNESEVHAYALLRGTSKSCGCLRSEIGKTKFKTHGMCRSGEYIIYRAMINRCYLKSMSNYKYYGGRGVTICARWKDSFELFFQDMGKRPSNKHSIDRIDPNGHYTPNNCKWATKEEQSLNKRSSKLWIVDGIEYNSTSAAAKKNGVSGTTIHGWCNGRVASKVRTCSTRPKYSGAP